MALIIADSVAAESARTPHLCEVNKNLESRRTAMCRSQVSKSHLSIALRYREPSHHGVMGIKL